MSKTVVKIENIVNNSKQKKQTQPINKNKVSKKELAKKNLATLWENLHRPWCIKLTNM